MFYLNFVRLCNSIGKSPSAVAEDMGLQRSSVTRWANGSAPRKATVEKIATYFGVDSKELIGKDPEQKEKPAPGGSELDLSGVSPEDFELLKRILAAPEAKKNAIRELL